MQTIDGMLPAYDEQRLQTEMDLFETWYLNRHLDVQLNESQKTALDGIFKSLIQNAVEQPQVYVHRDYHSRNLMITDENNPGVIDYQDAVYYSAPKQKKDAKPGLLERMLARVAAWRLGPQRWIIVGTTVVVGKDDAGWHRE